MNERLLKSAEHVCSDNRLTKRVYEHTKRCKTTTTWMKEVTRDMDELGLTEKTHEAQSYVQKNKILIKNF